MPTLASLSCPTPPSFGDLEEPTLEQDAAGALKLALHAIRRECGEPVRDCASYAIRALGENDGMTAKDLGDAIAFELDLDDCDAPVLFRAITELQRRSVIQLRGERLYLNPAVSEAVTREIHR